MRKGPGIAIVAGLAAAGLAFWFSRDGNPAGLLGKIGKGIDIFVGRLQEQGVPAVRLWIRDHALRRIWGISPADTSQVTPGLYVGGQQYKHGLARMAALGISATINLRREADDAARGVALARHLWLPTKDDAPPTLEQLDQATEFIRQALGEGRGVYIHCWSGVGRAPTTAAAYLISTGFTPSEAWTLIRRARPFIRPKAEQFEQIERFYDGKRKT